LELNWAVRFCSDLLYSSVEAFELDLAAGTLRRKVEELKVAKSVGQASRLP
jgi:hypothetical protein